MSSANARAYFQTTNFVTVTSCFFVRLLKCAFALAGAVARVEKGGSATAVLEEEVFDALFGLVRAFDSLSVVARRVLLRTLQTGELFLFLTLCFFFFKKRKGLSCY